MKRVHQLIGVVAATGLAGCACYGKSAHGPASSDAHRDAVAAAPAPAPAPVSNEPSTCRKDAVTEEVDRQFAQEHPGFGSQLGVYGKDRWYDLLDILGWDLSAGRGFGFNAHATEYLQAGINWWDGQSFGQRGRAFGVWTTSEVDRGLGPFYWVEIERSPNWGCSAMWDHEYKYTGWDLHEDATDKAIHQDWSEIGGLVHLFAVGVEANVSPIEAFDFVTGWFPIVDIMNDDTKAMVEQELRMEKGLGQ